jgi:hypothetical protein
VKSQPGRCRHAGACFTWVALDAVTREIFHTPATTAGLVVDRRTRHLCRVRVLRAVRHPLRALRLDVTVDRDESTPHSCGEVHGRWVYRWRSWRDWREQPANVALHVHVNLKLLAVTLLLGR